MTTRPDDVTDAAAATDGDTTLARARATWSDPAQPTDARVEALLGVMTTTEKVAQLGSTWHRDPDMFDRDGDGPERGGVAPMADAFGDVQSWEVVRAVGIGHLTRPFGTRPVDPGAGLADLAARQRDLVAHSRLGIPAIAHEECLTGFTTLGATVHPTPLALAATFDPSHARAIARGIADDLRAVDVHQALAPVLDVVGDPRWGRAGDGDLARAVEVVAEADLAVLVMADQPGMFGRGTSGEGNDATDLALPGRQAELADRVLATGTPVVVVVASGRPYALGGIADRAAAVVQAFLPGAEGGHAIAELLAGAIEPVGRLPIQVPQDPGGQPASHRHPVLGEAGLGISSADVVPAFPFGHGLSWTTFELTDLAVSPNTITTAGTVEVACTVTNTGDRPGTEVVQLYLDDPVAEIARPVRDLLGYARVGLDRGARATVRFTVHADRLAYTGRDGTRIVDAGEVRLHLGRSVGDLPLVATVTVTGQTRRVGHDRVLDTPAVVRPTTTTPSPSPTPTPDVG